MAMAWFFYNGNTLLLTLTMVGLFYLRKGQDVVTMMVLGWLQWCSHRCGRQSAVNPWIWERLWRMKPRKMKGIIVANTRKRQLRKERMKILENPAKERERLFACWETSCLWILREDRCANVEMEDKLAGCWRKERSLTHSASYQWNCTPWFPRVTE